MDCNGDHFLSSEFCFFDGKRKRCCGFVTLTASVHHPLLRKQVPLATMEAESEDQTNITLFWNLLNECLRKISRNATYTFNPVGWCTDMTGANLAGLKKVFGDTAINRIKTCEFHFKDHRNKNAWKLDAASAAQFKSPCNDLLLSTTEDGYESSKDKMESFIAAKEDRAFLSTWLSWWYARRGFIFRAFTPQDAPQMNQAEVIHAGWAHRDRQNLSMLDACQADTRDSLLLDIELNDYQSGAAPGGKGPSFVDREKKKHAREVSRAKRLGREMFPNKQDGQFIDPASSHCPRAKPRSRQNPKNKSQQQSAEKRNSSKSSQTSNTDSSIQPNRSNTTGPATFPTATISSTSNPATQSAQHVSYNHPPYLSSGSLYT